MVWNSARDSAWLPCFQKSICRNTSSRGACRRCRGGRKTGDLVLQHFKHLAATSSTSLLLFTFNGPKRECMISQTSPRGQQERPSQK